jgi:hypothetical protein
MNRITLFGLVAACGIAACSSANDAGLKPGNTGGAPSGGAGGKASGGAGGNASGGGGMSGGAGGKPGGGGAGRDAGQDSDGALAAFCTGSKPRMVVNGITTVPTVVGQQLALDCCEGGRFVVTTSDFVQPIAVEWREQAGTGALLPATVDLGSLPARWTVRLYAGCSVTSAGCLGALDNFTTGFAGSFRRVSEIDRIATTGKAYH